MKKLISVITAAAILILMIPALNGYADQDVREVFTVDIPLNQNGYIESESFDVSVRMSHNGSESRKYDIEISCGTDVFRSEADVASGSTVTRKINVTAKQGPCNIFTKIYYNGSQVYERAENSMVIVPYERQFMEDISLKGVNGAEAKNLNYFELMGLQSTRVGYEWGWTEKKKGSYDWAGVNQELVDAKAQPVFLVAYGNNIYSGETNDKKGPTTKEEIDAYAAYACAAARKYPSIKYFEIWNEPNISFWQPVPNVYDYVNLLQVAQQELHRVDESIVVLGGSMASSDGDYTERLFSLNAGAYMDAFSDHPYTYPGAADIYLQDQLQMYDERVLKHGGWMINASTEFGWPTHVGSRGVSVEQQAVETVKHYIIMDYNDYEINQVYRMDDLAINGSHDDTYNEDNFGLVYYDGAPKPAVGAVKTLCQMTNGGIPLGMLDTHQGINAYIYIKDGEPVIAAWRSARAPGSAPGNISFENEVRSYDMYGNLSEQGNTITLTEEPVYIKGASKDMAARALAFTMNKKFNEKCSILKAASQKHGYEKMKALLDKGVQMSSFNAMPSEEELSGLLDRYYSEVLGGMTELYKNGEFRGSIDDLTAMLYTAHLGGLRLMGLYMLSASGGAPADTDDAIAAVEQVSARIKSRAGAGTQTHAENIQKFAKETLEKLKAVTGAKEENPMKGAMSKAWDKMVKLLCETAVKVSELEEPGYDNILIQLPSSEKEFTAGTVKTAQVSLYNYTEGVLKGRVEVLDPAGRKAGESSQITLEPDRSMGVRVNVTFADAFEDGELCTLKFIGENGIEKSFGAPVNIAQGGEFIGAMTTLTAPDAQQGVSSRYQWMYSYDDATYHPMGFAVQKNYRVTNIDKNRYLMCKITPVYADGSMGESEECKFGYISKLGKVSTEWVSQGRRFETRFTPKENKFKLEGSNREYALLDTFPDEESSTYFILSDFLTANLEQHKIDPQNIDPNDHDSIGYWLNTEFINDGYSLAGVSWPKFDSRIYQYVDKSHKWWVEAGIEGIDGDNAASYSYTAGLGLLTESEAMKYWGAYGWNVTTENGLWHNPWLLATGSAESNKYIQIVNFKVDDPAKVYNAGEQFLNDVTPGTGHGELYARPAFYLGRGFFKNVRLDTSSIGENIKKVMRDNYTYSELSGIYTDEELKAIGFEPVSLSVISCGEAEGETNAVISTSGCNEGGVITALYDESDRCIGVVTNSPSENINVKINGTGCYIKVFWWDSAEGMRPVCPGIRRAVG